MGMTIDKAIAELELLKKNTFSYMSAHQAFITAIDAMRKYQKIEELIEYHMLKFLPKERMSGFQKDILEVIENENDD